MVGWLSTLVGTLYIERGKRSEVRRTRQIIAAEIERGTLIAVFQRESQLSGGASSASTLRYSSRQSMQGPRCSRWRCAISIPPAGTRMPPAMSGTPRSSKRSGPSSRRVTWLRSSIFSRRFPYGHRRGARSQKGPKPLSPAPWACPPRTRLHARSIGEARYLVQTPILQTDRAELSAPDATRIEGEELWAPCAIQAPTSARIPRCDQRSSCPAPRTTEGSRGEPRSSRPFVRNSITPSGVQKRRRVIALTITRSRSIPRSSSFQRSGSEP